MENRVSLPREPLPRSVVYFFPPKSVSVTNNNNKTVEKEKVRLITNGNMENNEEKKSDENKTDDVESHEATGGEDAQEDDSSQEEAEGNAEEQKEKLVRLPLGRIKSLIKMDPEVNMVNQEAVFLISKAAELFIDSLVKESYKYTAQMKKKLIQKRDIANAIDNVDSLVFLEGMLD